MNKRFLIIIAFIYSCALMATISPSTALTDTDKINRATGTDRADVWINSEALLWKIEKEGSIKNHLYGTFHIPDREVLRLSKETRKALDGSSIAAFEIVNEMKLKFGFTSTTRLTDGRSLKQILDPELYQQVIEMGKEYRWRERDIFGLKPWAASWIGGGTREQDALWRAGRPVLDDYLEHEAMKIGMKLEPLESATASAFLVGISCQKTIKSS